VRALIFLFLSIAAHAQVTFSVTPDQIGANESIQFEVRIDGTSGRRPGFPDGLDPGPFSLQSNTPMINSYQSFSSSSGVVRYTSYIFRLSPPGEGTFVFPAQKVRYEGKDWTSDPVTIEVGPERRSIPNGSRTPFSPFSRRDRTEPKVWIEIELDKERYYVGEPILLSVLIYRTGNVYLNLARSRIEMPDLGDFWTEEIETESFSRERVNRDGEAYYRSLAIARLMYANKTGTLTIDPATADLAVMVGSRFEIPRSAVRNSEPLEIEILPLPDQGKPVGFEGLVGSFTLTSEIDAERVETGESLSLNVTLEGFGNMAVLTEAKPMVNDGSFEIFDGGPPEIERLRGIARKKTWRYALVAAKEGTHRIKAPSLSYFDPDSGRYETTGGETFTVEVSAGEVLEGGTTGPVVRSGVDMKQSLSYIKMGELEDLDQRQELVAPRRLAQLGGGLLAMNAALFLVIFLRNRSMSRKASMRPRFALRNFKRATAKLRVRDEDSEAFYAGLSRAIFDYFGDKWERSGQGISLDLIADRFRHQGIDEALAARVTEIIEACDLARFTPSSPSSRGALLEKAGGVIEALEDEL